MKTIYKSELKELADKEFETVEALEAEESKVNTAIAKKQELAAEKKKELENLNKAAASYLEIVSENNKTRAELKKAEDEAYTLYKKELDAFSAKHQDYHLTYTKNGNNMEFQVEDFKQQTLEEIINELKKVFEIKRKMVKGFY